MLKVKLTENYCGMTIYGDFDDLDFLYDSINYLIHEDPLNNGEYTMQNHLYGFLYDVRHAYQGQRDIQLVDNWLSDSSRDYFQIKKKDATDKNVYYCFNYVLPDLLLDMVLIKYFIKKVPKKEKDTYNSYINMVNYFYSLILNGLQPMLTEIKFNKVKKGLLNSYICDTLFFPQWFELISLNYVKMNKEKRQKEFMHQADAIYNYDSYIDYIEMKKELEKMCEEKDCTLDDLYYDEVPEDINW